MRCGDSPPDPAAAPGSVADGLDLLRQLQAGEPTAGTSTIRGGHRAALARLAAIDPERYGASRNHLDGAVTRLSPYISHGVLSLAEVRDAVFAWLAATGREPAAAAKLISELAWRDYWQRLWCQWGDGIWHDREVGPAAAVSAGPLQPHLPADLAGARTGLACMDAFSRDLQAEGWLHNHARLWLASYVVHWRRVRWQAGAAWFLRHLLDGDAASNNLSWQWVAGTFSSRPYIFNRENLERFSGGGYCRQCALAGAGCPFEASYEELQRRLFAPPPAAARPASPNRAAPPMAPEAPVPSPPPPPAVPQRPIVWVHDEALGPANPALQAWPGAPALFVFDPGRIGADPATGQEPLSAGRLVFVHECLLELPVTIKFGASLEQLLAFAARHGADGIVTSRAVDPWLRRLQRQLADRLPLVILAPPPFVPASADQEAPLPLGRFSRYWRRAAPLVWSAFTAPPAVIPAARP
jgi:deoxyribodipyrimidine photo-lyase